MAMYKFVNGETVPMSDTEEAEVLAEMAASVKIQRRQAVLADLASIDLKSIRALREGNQTRIDELEAQAQTLRAELATL